MNSTPAISPLFDISKGIEVPYLPLNIEIKYKKCWQKSLNCSPYEHQSIQMLSLWMLGNSAHNDIFSEEVAVRLIEIAKDLDDDLQVLLHMALWEMRDMEVVRRYLRDLLDGERTHRDSSSSLACWAERSISYKNSTMFPCRKRQNDAGFG